MTENELKDMSELDQIIMFKNPATPETDRDLIGKILYSKYESMIHKHWWQLQKQMNFSSRVQSAKEEYYDEAIEAFFKAIDKVDLEKIYDKNFKLMQLASWYIGNVRIKWIKTLSKESGIVRPLNYLEAQDLSDSLGPDPEAEMAYWSAEGYMNEPSYAYERTEGEQNCIKAVKACMNKWSDLQKKIFQGLEAKLSKNELCDMVKLPVTELNKIIKGLKTDLKKELGLTA